MKDKIFRFDEGDSVWVRDRGHGRNGGGYAIKQATVRSSTITPADIRSTPTEKATI